MVNNSSLSFLPNPFNYRHKLDDKTSKLLLIHPIFSKLSNSFEYKEIVDECCVYLTENDLSEFNSSFSLLIADLFLSSLHFKEFLKIKNNLDIPDIEFYEAYSYFRLKERLNLKDLVNNYQKKPTSERNVVVLNFINLCFLILDDQHSRALYFGESLKSEVIPSIIQKAIKLDEYDSLLSFSDIIHLILLFELYYNVLEFEKACNILEFLSKIANTQRDLSLKIYVLLYQIKIEMAEGELLNAKKLLEEASEVESMVENDLVTLELSLVQAELHEYANELDKATEEYLSINIPKLDEYYSLYVRMKLAVLALKEGNYDRFDLLFGTIPTDALIKYRNLNLLYLIISLKQSLKNNDDQQIEEKVQKVDDFVLNSDNIVYLFQLKLTISDVFKKYEFYNKAIDEVEKLIEMLEKRSYFQFELEALLKILELYLSKYFKTEEIADFAKIFTYLDKLLSIAKKNEIPHINALALYMKGKILVSFNKAEEAKVEFAKALEIATKNNYRDLKQEILDSTKQLNYNSKILDDNHYNSLNKILSSYGRIKVQKGDKRRQIVKPQAFFIIDKTTGIPFYEYYFESKKTIESILLSGLITSVLLFASSIIDKTEVQHFSYEGFSIMLEIQDENIYVLITDYESWEYRYFLRKFILRAKEYGLLDNPEMLDSILSSQIKTLVTEMFTNGKEEVTE